MWGGVISAYKMGDLYASGEIDGVVISTAYHKRTVEDMIKACIKNGIRDSDIYLVKNRVLVTGGSDIENLIVPYKECIQIFSLSIHIVDHCNLKCELCCHNSQFVNGEVFVELEQYVRDLRRLHELVDDIKQICLVGGEPLLHPDLPKFIDMTRKIYPYAQILVVTNALLLQQSKSDLLECLKRNEVGLDISLYPPMHKQLDKLLEYANCNGLNIHINRVEKFFKKFSAKPRFNPKEMCEYCGYCMGLRNGKISRCIDSLFVEYFNMKFGNLLPDTAGIDIYDEKLDSLKLIHALEQPFELCAYCGAKYTLVDLYEWKRLSENITKENILIDQ